MTISLAQIASLLEVPLPAGADGGFLITGMATLEEAGPSDLSLLGHEKFIKDFERTRAGAVLVQRRLKLPASTIPVFVVDDADLAAVKVAEQLAPPVPRPASGVDPAARVAPTARLGENVAIGFGAYVGAGASVGRNTVLHPNVYVGDDVIIGDDCELFPGVVIRERVRVGSRVTIHAGSVLGTDGFGYRWDGKQHVKIPQIGTVVIEDDVEIGSCTCIDRARFSTTVIGRGSKIDNLVQVGHNVRTGPHCIIAGQAGLAGSAKLGAGVVLGGQAAVRDHVTLGDGSMLAACSGVMDDVEPKGIVSGLPALPHRQSLREQWALRRLPDLINQVKKLDELATKLREKLGEPQNP